MGLLFHASAVELYLSLQTSKRHQSWPRNWSRRLHKGCPHRKFLLLLCSHSGNYFWCLGQACCRLAKIFDLELDREIVTPLLQMKKKHYYFRKRSSSDADKSEIFNKSEKIICLFWSRVLGLVPVCKQLTKFFRVPGKVVKSSERKISMLIYFLLGKVFYNWEWSFLRRTTSTGDCFFL